MQVLTGQQLVDELRRVTDKISKRLWIAVPFIGGEKTITSVLGINWFANPRISVKLLTDASDFDNFNYSSLKLFLKRGEIKSLIGLHAKVYLLDNECFIASANLTNTAFSKRYEIGCHITGPKVKVIERIFVEWWKTAAPIKNIGLADILIKKSETVSKEEKIGIALPKLWKLPPSINITTETVKKKFLDYPLVIQEYKKFAEQYKYIQRIWKKYPLFLEIDTFLNYLYHEAPRRPSHKYKDKPARKLTDNEQLKELRKYAKQFDRYLNTDENPDHMPDQIKHHKIMKKKLSRSRINTLSKSELLHVFDNINALNSYPINKTRILNNNSLKTITQNLHYLLYGTDQLPARMSECSKIKFMGTSTINEILGYHNPHDYPIVNRNSSAGLRFFGFNVPTYR